jgi:hypothetical protein
LVLFFRKEHPSSLAWLSNPTQKIVKVVTFRASRGERDLPENSMFFVIRAKIDCTVSIVYEKDPAWSFL